MALKVEISGQTNSNGTVSLNAHLQGASGESVGLESDLSRGSTTLRLNARGMLTHPLGSTRGGCYRFTFRGASQERTATVLMDGLTPIAAARAFERAHFPLLDKLVQAATPDLIQRTFEAWDLTKFTKDRVVAVGTVGALTVTCVGFAPACAFAKTEAISLGISMMESFLMTVIDILHRDGVLSDREREAARDMFLVSSAAKDVVSLRNWNNLGKAERIRKAVELFGGLLDMAVTRSVRDTEHEATYTLFRDQFQKTYILLQLDRRPR